MVLPWAEMSSLLFQHLEDAGRRFSREQPTIWPISLAGDLDLHAIRVGHGIRLFGQVQQGLGNAAGHVQEGEVADLLAGVLQALGHWTERRNRMSGLTWISWRNFL